MKKFFKPIVLTVLIVAVSIVVVQSVSAGTALEEARNAVSEVELPTGEPEPIIGSIIQVFLSLFGIIFFGLMVYGGYKWMIAQGREEEVKKAKDIIRSAIIGLGVVFLAYAISVFVIGRFSEVTSSGFGGAVEDTCEVNDDDCDSGFESD